MDGRKNSLIRMLTELGSYPYAQHIPIAIQTYSVSGGRQ